MKPEDIKNAKILLDEAKELLNEVESKKVSNRIEDRTDSSAVIVFETWIMRFQAWEGDVRDLLYDQGNPKDPYYTRFRQTSYEPDGWDEEDTPDPVENGKNRLMAVIGILNAFVARSEFGIAKESEGQ